LLYSVKTGKSGFEKSLGMPIFDWLANHPEEASLFNETMVGVHGADAPAVATAYDFSGLATVVDVGGGTGNLLTTILANYPASRGILFDLPNVVRDAPALIQSRGMADRVTIEAGSSSIKFQATAMPIFFRTSSRTGRRTTASRSSVTVGAR
jgi:O-methyltransferase domain